MRDSLSEEIIFELLTDLHKAISEVVKNTLPQLNANVRIIKEPYLGIIIRVDREVNPNHYPDFVYGEAVLRPTKEGRAFLGLGEE